MNPPPPVAPVRPDDELRLLRNQLDHLKGALELAGISLWDWHIATGAITRPFNLAPREGLVPEALGNSYDLLLRAIHPDDRAAFVQTVERAVQQNLPLEAQFRVCAADGSIRWRETKGRVVRDAAGTPVLVRGIGRDITQRRQAEEALRASEERFRQVAENIEEVFWLSDPDIQQIIYISPAYEKVWGRSCASLYKNPRSYLDAIHADDRGRVVNQQLGRPGQAFDTEYRIVRPDGSIRWIRDRGFPIRDAAGQVYRLTGIAMDVTRLKAAEESLRRAHDNLELEVANRTAELSRANEALRQAEAKYRDIFEHATEGVFQTTPDGRFLSANPALAKIDGFASAEELMAQVGNIAEQLYIDPGRRAEFARLIAAQGYVREFESQLRRKDGRIIWVSENARVVRDAAGQVLYYEGTVQDITERKHLEDQLRQAQKMEAIGRLAGGVAHDFNNLLTGIIGYADLLMTGRGIDDPMFEDLAQIKRAGERAAALTGQLLAFSRRQILAPRVIDLNAVVADMEKMLRRLLGEDVELLTRLGPDLGRVRADPGQIEQVILNLSVNARDAMPQGGRLTIRTSSVVPDEALLHAHPEMHRGPHVVVTVSDTGVGMDQTTLTHLFEPFFTTKEVGKGTGLGLATIYGIVKQSEGQITVTSTPGQGTTFTIYLPCCEEAPRKARRTAPSFQLPSGSETILLVEDEEVVRNLAQMVLQHQGYKVMVAAHGPDALKMGLQYDGTIHLLVADVVMPIMSGRQVAQQLGQVRPDMKVLYLSGYTNDAVLRHGVREAEAAFLAKPFTPDALAQKVREALDGAAWDAQV